ATAARCTTARSALVHVWASIPSAPGGSDINGWADLGIRPCADGAGDFDKAGLLPGTTDVVLNFLQGDGTFVGTTSLIFPLVPGPQSMQFNFLVPNFVTAPVALSWQIFRRNGLVEVSQTCAQVGADTVRVRAGSGASTTAGRKPLVAGVLPCGTGGTL